MSLTAGGTVVTVTKLKFHLLNFKFNQIIYNTIRKTRNWHIVPNCITIVQQIQATANKIYKGQVQKLYPDIQSPSNNQRQVLRASNTSRACPQKITKTYINNCKSNFIIVTINYLTCITISHLLKINGTFVM